MWRTGLDFIWDEGRGGAVVEGHRGRRGILVVVYDIYARITHIYHDRIYIAGWYNMSRSDSLTGKTYTQMI